MYIFKLVVTFVAFHQVTPFVVQPSTRAAGASMIVRQGFLDKLMNSGQSADDDWKEESFRKQQEILRKRRENGGFISEEETAEIQNRRLEISSEERMLREVQQGKEGADGLDKWKQLRDEGKIKTASSGLVRDEDSSRLGSEGLFAERIDAKLPYIDSGYVPEGEEEKGGGDFFGCLAKMFGKK